MIKVFKPFCEFNLKSTVEIIEQVHFSHAKLWSSTKLNQAQEYVDWQFPISTLEVRRSSVVGDEGVKQQLVVVVVVVLGGGGEGGRSSLYQLMSTYQHLKYPCTLGYPYPSPLLKRREIPQTQTCSEVVAEVCFERKIMLCGLPQNHGSMHAPACPWRKKFNYFQITVWPLF